MMSPTVRKASLTVHIATAVGWLGAVGAFGALALVGLTSRDQSVVRSVSVAMGVVTWWAIVPVSLLSLVVGIVQSVGTPWGLLRHYWVVAKLVLTAVATLFLLLHTSSVDELAAAALMTRSLGAEERRLQLQLAVDAGAAIVVLLVALIFSVIKPKGLTPFQRASDMS